MKEFTVMPDSCVADLIESEKRQAKRENKIMRRLERTLKPKVLSIIKWLLHDHRLNYMQIVTIQEVKGSKEKASEWLGDSCPIRFIYDDTTQDYWGDGYGGSIYLPIGKGRYLELSIWG